MIILNSLEKFSAPQFAFVLTIGNFDGVHLGHQKLLKNLIINETDKTLVKSIVVTFDPHPVEFFDKSKTFRRLFSASYQNDRLEELGIDYILRLKFDTVLANLTYEEFLNQLNNKITIKKIVIGHDLKIGKNRQGDRKSISHWCQTQGIEFQMIDPLIVENQIVSSTYIKTLVDNNQFEAVPRFLGRPYSISGVVIHGDKRGRLIGFPTANLKCPRSLFLPHFGVYQTHTMWNFQRFDSITNVGKTPTFKSDDQIKVETHLFNFNEEIYDDKISIEFIKFIRSEQKFSGIEEIKKQIALDIASLNRSLKI